MILLEKSQRVISKDLSFSYKATLYQIRSNYQNRLSGKRIDIYEKDGEIAYAGINGKQLKIKKWQEKIIKRPNVLDSKGLEALWPAKARKPGKHHPWK